MEIKIHDYTNDILKRIDDNILSYGLKVDFGWLLDDTLHLNKSYISNSNRYYFVTIFNNPYMNNFYLRIKCGEWLTKINLHTFKPLTSEYKTITEFMDFMETGEYKK